MVLYLKYRPQKIAELDSSDVRERLTKTLSSSYRPHAFLLTGPKGTGKTSTARLIAKVFNCETTDSIEPCNVCEACIAITRGTQLDVMEIDAASNRGIDEIRDLREKIKLAPISLPYKIYIIDEVHMLTTEAFNALLKTLEEPPPRVVFILATTEAGKLPATILSRCSTFSFQKATEAEVVHCLTRIVKGENVSVDSDILTLIAHASDGSFRDATKMLEQVISEGATEKKTEAARIIGKDFSTEEFLVFLSQKKLKETVSFVVDLASRGVDFRSFLAEILHTLHHLLLHSYGIDKEKESTTTLQLSTSDLIALIKLFSRVYTEIKTAESPEIPLEIAVVEWCENNIK